MKKIQVSLCAIICAIMVINVAGADLDNTVILEYESDNITVIFNKEQVYDEEICNNIADYIVYGTEEYDTVSISWCWLFGHDITTTTVTTITHKVQLKSPRCLREIHNVETCSKCDYINDEVISSVYIVCHPND